MPNYAQIDINNIVVSVTELHSQETYEHLIPIDTYDIILIGKQYDPVNQTFTYPQRTLDQLKADKKTELLQAYYGSFSIFQSSATGTLKTYPIDKEAQDNLRDYQSRAMLDPSKDVFAFKTIDDKTLIDHTRAQFLQLLDDAELFKVQQTRKLNNLENQVDAADENTIGDIRW